MTKARDLSKIIGAGGIIDNTKITLDANEIPNIDAGKITSGSIASARLGNIDLTNLSASNLTSGSIADARVPASAVSQHATSFDDNAIVNDLSTIALRQATNENAIAYNTNSSFVDVFQDSSGIASHTTSSRNASEFVSATTTGIGTSTITLNASNYQTYIDITADDMMSVRNHSTGSESNAQHYSTAQANNTDFASGSNYQAGQAIANSHEATLLGYMFGSESDNSTYEINNNDSSETHRLIYHNIKFKSGVTFKPNGTFSFNAKNGTGNWNNLEFYSINSGNFASSHLGSESSPNGVESFQVSNSPTSGNLSIRIYHNANNSYMFNALSIAGDVTAPTTVVSATGNFISNAITASSSTNKMGAIITYQNQAGTNTLNTDIVLQLSADNGSTFQTATLTALPNFATGIKMAKVNDLAVSAGTQLKYKILFANQSGSKEARIRGVSLQY